VFRVYCCNGYKSGAVVCGGVLFEVEVAGGVIGVGVGGVVVVVVVGGGVVVVGGGGFCLPRVGM